MGALEFDVSSLSVGEMRRLIAQKQARGQTALADYLQLELNGRLRRMAAPHLHAVPDARAEYADDDRATPEAAARSGWARAWQLAAAALAGAAVASAAGWWLTSTGPGPRPAPEQAAPALPTAPQAAPQTAPMSASEAPSPPLEIPVPAAPTARAPAHSPAPASRAHRQPAGCRAPATPGWRTVCANRGLLAQDQRMLRAYQRALAAGANRLTLDRGQAQWREAADRTSSPTRLAHLYRARIAALHAAARHPHGTPRRARHRRWWW